MAATEPVGEGLPGSGTRALEAVLPGALVFLFPKRRQPGRAGSTALSPPPPRLSPGNGPEVGVLPIPAPQGEACASGLQVTWTASREFHHTLSCSQLTLGAQEGGRGRLWGCGWLFWSQKGALGQPSWPEKAELPLLAPVPPPAQPGEAEAEWGQRGAPAWGPGVLSSSSTLTHKLAGASGWCHGSLDSGFPDMPGT